jgi:hypothetical protein
MSPALLLLLLLATLSAMLAHLLWGRSWLQIPLYWIAACAGCLIAYAASIHIPIPLRLLYPAGVPVLEAVLMAWILMFIASRVRV